MGKLFRIMAGLFLIPALAAFHPYIQEREASITLLDRSGESIEHLIDGNLVKLEIRLPGPQAQDQTVTFTLGQGGQVLGSCVIPAGQRRCMAGPLFSLGWYWDENREAQPSRSIEALDQSGRLIGSSETIGIAPRPVVMVHGFISSWDTWKPYLGPQGFLASLGLQGFAVGDGQVPGALNTGSLLNPSGRTNTIGQNAEILGHYIAGVKRQTGAEMVDLVAHSMGGMISRYYIDRLMQERDVAQLVMLGSPMGGTDCSVLPASLGFYLPASLEIRSSYMRGIYNQQITHRNGVHFYDLAGTFILQPHQSPCTEVPNDSVVSVGSVNAIPLESQEFQLLHTDLTISPQVFRDFVQPLLQNTLEAFMPAQDPAQPAPQESGLQFTRVYQGHVEPGGSTEITINIESGIRVASFALYDPTRSTTVSVRGASGNVIELDPAAHGLIRIDDPASMLYLGYGFQDPKPGPWRVSVLAGGSTPDTGADFAISVYFVGGASLQASSSTLIPKVGEPVTFRASLSLAGQPVALQEGQLLVRHPDGKLETLELPAGAESQVQWAPGSPGVYGVDVVVSGQTPAGEAIERTGFLSIEAQPDFSQASIDANLLLVVGGVLLLLALLGWLLVQGVRRLARRGR